ncbi:transposase [Salinispora arenicola]|uniref:integrase core domain-containing protein n=1 Tax=Salinispora arenicola TaxID=168697 RepID=UPI0016ADD264|nr:integrase core domain-containing protein [Salinispora arenicola]NIL59726.1 transposase [Salinispora arenicola]
MASLLLPNHGYAPSFDSSTSVPDNGKQFTGRFTKPRPAEVMFERICRENGIVVRNTKPRTPTTTGKIERFHQSLQRELLDHVEVFADLDAAQAGIDAFRAEYNTDRPHQSLDMDFPADRFIPRPAGQRQPLRLPTTVSPASSEPHPTSTQPSSRQSAVGPLPAITPPLPTNGVDPVILAVEFTRVVQASGNLTVCSQQFWLGPDRAGTTIAFWADSTVVHLLADDARPAGPPPLASGVRQPGVAVEVDRLVNATGAVALAGRQHPVGYHFAGRRFTVRIDGGLLQLVADGILLRSLPNRLTPADLARLRDARPAGPPPNTPPEPLRVETAGQQPRHPSPSPGNASTSTCSMPGSPSPSRPPTTPSASSTATS